VANIIFNDSIVFLREGLIVRKEGFSACHWATEEAAGIKIDGVAATIVLHVVLF
jgi:hypothetical protein